MRKSVITAIPAALLLCLAACGGSEAVDDSEAMTSDAEEPAIEVDVPDIPARDIMVPVESEDALANETSADESMDDHSMDDESEHEAE